MKGLNPDLPGDENFRAINGGSEILDTPFGPAWAITQTISAGAQADLHHNRLRYAELQKLRLGQPNLYEQSRYRH